MATLGRPNRTGRSSGKLFRKERELVGPPAGESWVWMPAELLTSAALRGASIHTRKFLDFLLVEHCRHAGRGNGQLIATYDQLVKWGLPRKRISNAIRDAVARGLIEVTMRGGLFGVEERRTPSRYRLTWIGSLDPLSKPTHEWRDFQPQAKTRGTTLGTAGVARGRAKAA
jgi:hypothetical protein